MSARPLIVTHPVHQHAYETALAAQRAELLDVFWTGFYDTGRGLTSPSVLGRLPPRARGRVVRELGRRHHPGLDPARVRTLPLYDGLNVAWRRVTGARQLRGWDPEVWMLRSFDAAVARRLVRRPPALVHAFEGAARETLAATRRRGGFTILDCPSPHERFVAVERAEGCRRRHATASIRAERALADRLLAPSPCVAACLEENGVDPERIVLLPYGVDPNRFAPDEARAEEDGVFRVLFVGRIEPRKGVRDLLAAWGQLALPRAELVLLGPPGPGARELLREAPGSVRWVPGVPRLQTPDFYKQADVFAFPSLAEGSALVTYEAMAAGLPSVVTLESGSVVRDGRDGFIVPARAPAALAERIRALHADPAQRRELGRSARAQIVRRWTWRHYAERLVAVWRAGLASGS